MPIWWITPAIPPARCARGCKAAAFCSNCWLAHPDKRMNSGVENRSLYVSRESNVMLCCKQVFGPKTALGLGNLLKSESELNGIGIPDSSGTSIRTHDCTLGLR